MIIPTSLRPPDSAPMQTEVVVAVKTPREAAEAAEGDARFLLQLLATECRWLVNAMYDYPPGLDVPSEVTIYVGAICYIYFEVQRAREFLAETDRLLEAAADGLRTMGRAVAACPTTPSNVHLHQRLLQAEICVRDVAVWRCQMTVPFDNRDAFRLRLSEVFYEDENFLSRLLHAQHRIVSKVVATFLSNTEQCRRRNKREKKCKNKGSLVEGGLVEEANAYSWCSSRS